MYRTIHYCTVKVYRTGYHSTVQNRLSQYRCTEPFITVLSKCTELVITAQYRTNCHQYLTVIIVQVYRTGHEIIINMYRTVYFSRLQPVVYLYTALVTTVQYVTGYYGTI